MKTTAKIRLKGIGLTSLRVLKWGVGVLMVLVVIIIIVGICGVRYVNRASLPGGFYYLDSSSLKHNDIVTFCLKNDFFIKLAKERGYLPPGCCSSGLTKLAKKVCGLPGDVVVVSSDGSVTVNGKKMVGPALRFDGKGMKMPESHLKSGVIPEGKVLLLSDYNPNSFDGRYFGLTDIKDCQKLKPIFTFE